MEARGSLMAVKNCTWRALEKGGLAVDHGGHVVLKKEACLCAAAAATFC